MTVSSRTTLANRMLRQARISMVLALFASAAILAACGEDEVTIPSENAEAMLATLDAIEIGDAVAARAWMTAHIAGVETWLRKAP